MGKGLSGCMKRVYIYAYTEVNLGDDLFIHQLIRRYPGTQFVMIANKQYKLMLKPYKNVLIHDKYSILAKVLQKLGIYGLWERKVIAACDYAVYIGGSVFMEYERWKDQYLWYQNLFDNSKLLFIGCNWGPYKNESFYLNMKNVLGKMKDVCFRDRKSYNLFSDLSNTRYAPDILFSTKFPDIEKHNQIFVSVIDCSSKEEGGITLSEYECNYFENLKKIIVFFSAKGFEIKLVSFCEKENDSSAICHIKDLLDCDEKTMISELVYDGNNLNHILAEMKASKLIVGSRFHSVILGMVANVPVIPFVYSDKTINVLEDMDYQGIYIDIRKSDSIDVTNLENSLNTWKTPDLLSDWIEESNKHFHELDTVLENK